MKRFKNTLILCLFLSLIVFLPIKAQYYYSGGMQIPLSIDSSRVTLKFDTTISELAKQSFILSLGCLSGPLEDDYLIHGFVSCSLYNTIGYFAHLDSLKGLPEIKRVEPYYLTEDSIPILMGLSIFVLFNEGVTLSEIESLNAIYNLEISGCPEGRPNVYYLKVTDSTEYFILDLANIYYELPQTMYAHPDFSVAIIPDGYKLYDYYNEHQWHIKKVIGEFNEATVWDFAGLDTSIKVAVLDDGLDGHPDIDENRVMGSWNFLDETNSVTPESLYAHGMACTGIIAANHTTDSTLQDEKSTGIVSMNPYSIIIPLKILNVPCGIDAESLYSAAITFAWYDLYREADIISCSWHANTTADDDLKDAIETAKNHGRNGLGCPVIFSSGNTGSGNAGPVKYPARLEYCFAVGALNSNDYRWSYSHYDTTLDIVAPSGAIHPKEYTPYGDVWTLDQTSIYGVNPAFIHSCPND